LIFSINVNSTNILNSFYIFHTILKPLVLFAIYEKKIQSWFRINYTCY